jgi:hypothetical protein
MLLGSLVELPCFKRKRQYVFRKETMRMAFEAQIKWSYPSFIKTDVP